MCIELVCAESEYEARKITVVKSAPDPDEDPCNKDSKKPIAEQSAQDQLKDAVKAMGETGNCKKDPTCRCELPPWPDKDPFGWKLDKANQTSVQDVDFGPNCKWHVTLQYNLWYRKRTGDCRKKPPS
jgi:hypothetical protein